MTTVVGLTARYSNFLLHPLPAGQGVCTVCRGPAHARFPACRPCDQARRGLGGGTADVVVPVSLAVKRGQFANELWRYKNTHGPQQDYFRMGLAAVLWRFLAVHEACVAARCHISGFDLVTIVPSTSGRDGHPLRRIVADMIGQTAPRYRDLLTPTSCAAGLERQVSRGRYSATVPHGAAVLLVDDTWTTGNHVQSAATALKSAGASTVAAVVLGRHVNSEYNEQSSEYVRRARTRRFSWDHCSVHGARTPHP